MSNIILKEYNWDTKETIVVGEVSVYTLVRSMSTKDFCDMLDEFVNVGMKDYNSGIDVGKNLQGAHRTIQASIIRFCLGIIVGLSETQYTDERNEMPVAMGQEIKRMVKNGILKMGWMI